jgi:hypothetical protein
MTQHTSLAALALALLVPAAGCGNTTAEPIGSGGSSSASSASSGGTGGDPSASSSSGGGGDCSPGCGASEVCVASTCHALLKLDSSSGSSGCAIVLDATSVYWATSEVRIVPRGGGEAKSFGQWIANPTALWVDDTYLYFDGGSGGVIRGAKDGKSGFTQFAGGGTTSPTYLIGDGTTLYYLDAEGPAGVYQAPTTGTLVNPQDPPVEFATGIYGIGTLAVDATNVYFWGAAGLVKQDKTTHVQTNLSASATFDGNIDATTGIFVDGDTVYYSAAPAPGIGGVVASFTGAAATSNVIVDGKSGLTGVFTADADSLYYMTFSGVMKVSKAGGDPVLLSALSLPSPFATCMAADDQYVYWVDGGDLMQYKK